MVSEDLDGVLALDGATGRELGFSDSGGGDGGTETITTVLGEDGPYRVLARGFAGSTGGYRIRLSYPSPTAHLTGDGPVSGSIERTTDDLFSFDGTAGTAKLMTLESVELDGVLEVYGPSGEQLAVRDEGGGSGGTEEVAVILSETGRHWVVVRGFEASTGEYNLVLESLDATPVDVEQPARGNADASARAAE